MSQALKGLQHPAPLVRRWAARQLGWLAAAELIAALKAQYDREPSETVRLALVVALERCGATTGGMLGVEVESQREAERQATSSPPLWALPSADFTRVASLEALGWWGRPAAARPLRRVFSALHSPSRGVALRQAAAIALGRLGRPDCARFLLRQLAYEDLRGRRPGAGMGVQRPVDHALCWALGEVGHLAAIRPLQRRPPDAVVTTAIAKLQQID